MSGPKSGSYKVVSAQEQRRRAIAAAKDRYSRVRAEAQAFQGVLAAAVATYGDLGIAAPADTIGHARKAADWDRAGRALTSAIAAARRQLDEAVAAARTRSLLAAGAGICSVLSEEDTEEETGESRRGRLAEKGASGKEAQQEADRQRLRGVLARLPSDAPAAAIERCERLASAYLAASGPSEKANILDGLQMQVQVQVDRQARIARNGVAIEAQYRELDGLGGERVDTVRGKLKGLDPAMDLPAGLREEVAAAKAAAEAERDREFVLAAAAKALGELGYQVGDDFMTAVPADGTVLELPHSLRHGLRIRESGRRLMLNVVRFDPDGERDPAADRDAEVAFCRDFDKVRERLRADGVDLTMLRADAPGQTRVQVIRAQARARVVDRDAVQGASAAAERERRP